MTHPPNPPPGPVLNLTVARPTIEAICALIRDESPGCAELAGACDYEVHKLARICGCSVRQLERAFHQFNRTPHNWLVEQRLLRQLQRLEELDSTGHLESMKRIAIEFGYRYPANFDRAFKKVFGTSPSAFLDERTKVLKVFGIDLAECRLGRQPYPVVDL